MCGDYLEKYKRFICLHLLDMRLQNSLTSNFLGEDQVQGESASGVWSKSNPQPSGPAGIVLIFSTIVCKLPLVCANCSVLENLKDCVCLLPNSSPC